MCSTPESVKGTAWSKPWIPQPFSLCAGCSWRPCLPSPGSPSFAIPPDPDRLSPTSEFPARLTPVFAVALPALEILVAAALVPSATVAFGAGLALALLVVFIIGIGRSLILGHRPSCHCFGQLRSEPVGPGVLVRNGVLATIALLVLIASWRDPAPSLGAWLIPLSGFERALVAGGVAGLALLSAQVVLLVRLTGQNERILGRLGEPGPQAADCPMRGRRCPGRRRHLRSEVRRPHFRCPRSTAPT